MVHYGSKMCICGTDSCSLRAIQGMFRPTSTVPPAGEHPGLSSLSFYSADFSNCKFRRFLIKNQCFSTFLIKSSQKWFKTSTTPALDTEPSALQGFSTEGSNHLGNLQRKLTVPTASGQSCQAPQGQWFPQFHGTRWRSRWRNAGKGD